MSDFLVQLSAVPSRGHGAAITTDNDYDRQLRDLLAYLKQPGLVPSTADLNDFLEAVNPAVHSLSFLFLLRFQIHLIQKRTNRDVPDDLLPGHNLWKYAVRFLRLFDPIQVRYAGHEWRQLVELIASAAQSVSNPVLAVKVIRNALERFDTSGTFTSIHLLFVKLALHSSSYAYALPILDKFLYQLPADTEHACTEHLLCSVQTSNGMFITDSSGFSGVLTYRDYLQFYLYSAMIHMAVKQWDRASHCLNIVVSSPTANSVSKIMVEAYKKWTLVNLLGHGKLPPTSSLIAPHVMRVYQSLARPYISLAEAFEKGDMRKLAAEINIGRAVWRADNNSGLVSQIFDAYDKFVVIKLGIIFSALTMPDVLQRASPCLKGSHDIEEFVVSLVMSNALRATLSHSSSSENTTMLRFAPTTRTRGVREEYIRARLIQTKHALTTIAGGIIQTDRTLGISNENLQFTVKNQTWNGKSEKSGVVGSFEVDGGDVGDIEEDLMGNAY